MVKWDSMFES